MAAAVVRDKNTPLSDLPAKKRLSLSLKNPNHVGACVAEEQQSIAAKSVVAVNSGK